MDNSDQVIWLNKGHSFWDQTLLENLLKDLPKSDRQLVIVPGTINTSEEVNATLSQYSKVLVILTSDEQSSFLVDQLDHPDMIIYVTYPDLEKHRDVARFLPIGYPPRKDLVIQPKRLPWFFAGQVNHKSREDLVKVLRETPLGKLIETEGFSQGLEYSEYLKWMIMASIIPCPGGPHSPDSFRLYEALDVGGIPIPDHPEFWRMLFGDVPFPTISDWSTLPDLMNNLKDRPEQNNICFAWWQRQKRQIRYNLEDDLGIPPQEITVLIPTSPIPSHPDTKIIDETIKSVRERLPGCEVVLMIDGVREEQADRRPNYTEYTRRLLWKANHEWKNVYPLLFEGQTHQANMSREALRHVRTPWVLFVEHDTPLTGEIPFEQMTQTEGVNLIRFHYEAAVHPEHKHLMLDTEPQLINGVPLLRCAQWSQRPHLARTDFYRNILDDYFPVTANTMIEDLMYGVLYNAFVIRGTVGWNDFKVWMYAPEGDIKRSLNLDGREDDPKYEMNFE